MSKVFIGCSSYRVDEKYNVTAREVSNLCASKEYDLVFGACTNGIMGIIYNEYTKYSNRNIDAICLSQYKEDLDGVLDKYNKVLVDSVHEQIDYFMNCDKLIFLSGGYGSLNELMYLINAKANHIHDKEIIIVNFNNFYDKILEHFDKCYEEGFIGSKDLYKVVNSISELEPLL